MPYAAFEITQVPVGGQPKRGVKAVCGHCQRSESIHVNTNKSHGDDDEQVERAIARRFEGLGWKIGKTAAHHRCPQCFSAIKASTKRRNSENPDNKIIPITPSAHEPPVMVAVETAIETPAPRRPSRDERRIIHNKIDEKYGSESSGYVAGWNDERVAKDLGVPIDWVSEIRDENFGPNIDEAMVQTMTEAKGILEELRAARYTAQPVLDALKALDDRAAAIEQALIKIGERK